MGKRHYYWFIMVEVLLMVLFSTLFYDIIELWMTTAYIAAILFFTFCICMAIRGKKCPLVIYLIPSTALCLLLVHMVNFRSDQTLKYMLGLIDNDPAAQLLYACIFVAVSIVIHGIFEWVLSRNKKLAS